MSAQIQKPSTANQSKFLCMKKLLSTSALTATLVAFSTHSALADPAWTGFTDTTGAATFDATSTVNTTNITQTTATFIGTSSNLDIDAGYTVNIDQVSSDSLFAAKAAPDANPTRILGNLNANGRVLIIDNGGVYFGADSRVDVNGIIATTGNISNEQINNNQFGDYTIEDVTGSGRIDLKGEVTVADAGLAAFVAPTIVNSGVINAKMGKVAFAAGDKVTLDFYGDNLIEIEAGDELADAYIENSDTGRINAEGGVVQISAVAAKDAVDNIINVDGIVNVSSATVVGGKIILGGGNQGTVRVKADLKASETTGGTVEVTGQNVQIATDSEITADGADGNVSVTASGTADILGDIKANNGEIQITSDNTNLAGTLQAQSAIFRRNTLGEVSLGSATSGLELTQAELNNITADILTIGNANGTNSQTTDINVAGVDLAAINTVNLNALASSSINYSGTNNFTVLNAATDTINVLNGSVNATNSINFDAQTVNLNGDLDAPVITGTATTVNVQGANAQIADGIDVAMDGTGTVNVAAGSFSAFIVDKDVTVNGANAGISAKNGTRGPETIITTGILDLAPISITADGATVDGFTTLSGFAGVQTDANNVSILNNIVTGTRAEGIFATAANNLLIQGNRIASATTHGVSIIDGTNIDVLDNQITDAGDDGIQVLDSTGVSVDTNTIDRTGEEGIVVTGNVDGLQIIDNTITTTGLNGGVSGNGIELNNTLGFANINGNTITNAGNVGILVVNPTAGSTSVNVDANTITQTDEGGILITGGALSVSGNTVDNTNNDNGTQDDDGIEVSNSNGVQILNNVVGTNGGANNIQGEGIDVNSSESANISGNTVRETTSNGISVALSNLSQIVDNNISDTNANGIDVRTSDGAIITSNTIGLLGGTNNIDGHGVLVDSSDNVLVELNQINETNESGVQVTNSVTVQALRNTITNAGIDGLAFQNVNGLTTNNNIITASADDGIDLTNVQNTTLDTNTINNVNGNGVEGQNVTNLDVLNNIINSPENEGISIETGANTDILIDGNTINNPNSDGIIINGSTSQVIISNNILDGNGNGDTNATDEGIDINTRVSDLQILNNTITGFDDQGIEFDGSTASPTTQIVIDGNTITNNGNQGIEIDGNVSDITITDNTISNNGNEGIDIDGSTTNPVTGLTIENNIIASNTVEGIKLTEVADAVIVSNTISDNGIAGLHTVRADNGSIILANNTFTDNPIGALFESGEIDLTGLANSITNTVGGTPVGLQFDEVGAPGSLSLVGNTLGGTAFTGFTNPGSFYVRLEDGSFLDTITGAPIVINGLDATFDGILPSSTGGILSQADLDFLEDRIFDADDIALNGRGQIFVGAVSLLNVEDFFNEFGAFDAGPNGLNVTITGLPSVISPGVTANTAAALNLIAPAGGDEAIAGLTPEQLVNLEPAAGNEDTACWTDAAGAASAGTTVSYNFGGTFEESIADAAACGAQSL